MLLHNAKHQKRKQLCFSSAIQLTKPSPSCIQGQGAQVGHRDWKQQENMETGKHGNKKTWKQENTSHITLLEEPWPRRGSTKKGWLEMWHPKHPKPSIPLSVVQR